MEAKAEAAAGGSDCTYLVEAEMEVEVVFTILLISISTSEKKP